MSAAPEIHVNLRNPHRRGSVYLAVLGTSLVVSVLALSALAIQRVQNRMLVASADIRQAQLNAEAAIELGLLAIKEDEDWRTTYANGTWFNGRNTGTGSCTLQVVDPIDADLDDDSGESIVMTGIGASGSAVQRVVRTVDPEIEPLTCLYSSMAAGDAIGLSGSVLRATNSGLITANSTSATASTVYGKVKAVTIGGATYSGTTTQVSATGLPTMPDWATVFDYYRTNGTSLDINLIPSTTPNLGRDTGFEFGAANWTGTPPGVPYADITVTNSVNHTSGGANSLFVDDRAAWNAGPSQMMDGYIKPSQQYTIQAWVYLPSFTPRNFRIRLTTKGTGSSEVNNNSPDLSVSGFSWTRISATLPATSWTGDLEYAFFKIAGADSSNTNDFFVDDLDIRETTTGKFIFRKVLGPGINSIYAGAPVNALGLYWIDCGGNKLIIERSRIKGTLLLVNPGAGSCVAQGPIRWSPAMPGYPALLVDADTAANADFTIAATNRRLSEPEDGINFNPSGAPSEDFGQDSDLVDSYPSEIQGMIVVEDDLTFQNNALVRGQIVAGDDVSATSGTLEIDFRLDSLLSPPPGFTAPSSLIGRPQSIRKDVLP